MRNPIFLLSPSILLILSLLLYTPSASARSLKSDPPTLHNRHVDEIIQEPLARAQARVDAYTAKQKRGEFDGVNAAKGAVHHPKFRPTKVAVGPLETGTWEVLAVIKARMEEDGRARQVANAHADAPNAGAPNTDATRAETDGNPARRKRRVDGFETVVRKTTPAAKVV